MPFRVFIRDKLDNVSKTTICRNEEELSSLLMHIDKEKFAFIKAEHIDTFDNFTVFCKEDKNLETGKK